MEQWRVLNAGHHKGGQAHRLLLAWEISQGGGQKMTYNKMAVIGLVVSVISLFLDFWGIVAIAGVIVSVIGFLDCKKTNEKGEKLAIIGIALGAISILWTIIIMF